MIYTISLQRIFGETNLCQNPVVSWETPGCPDIICGRENSTTLKIDVPDHCVDRCVYVIIDCTDTCSTCQPQRVQVCPCDGPGDCAACETCVGNLCVSKCPDGWFCENETCVECDTMHPCPDGKVCNGGKCVCPPDKPFMDAEGNCSDCNDANPCPPCYTCTPVGCVPVVCESGVCDPDTGDCVECIGAVDCGLNKCCENGLCRCCPGFILDENGNCIPDPGCLRDSDCPPCYTCDRVTGCVPSICPAGYIRIDSEPCCVKECNCADPICSNLNQRCISASISSIDPANANKCYCAPCNGPCDSNQDCGPGCYCNGVECVTNPCFGGCVTGSDCGEGCGCGTDGMCYPCDSADCTTGSCASLNGCQCSPTGECEESPCAGPCAGPEDCAPGCGCVGNQCVSCSTLTCDQCLNVAGCDCTNGQDCVGSPCNGPCADGNDCGVGCGCLFGQCVSCEQYSCQNAQQCPNGCSCNENGTCVDNPCVATRCDEPSDCGFGCKCASGGFCEPCPPNDPLCGNNQPCLDSSRIFAEGCKLTAEYVTAGCCACDPISIGVDIVSYNNGTLSLTAGLRNGEADDFTTFGTLLPLTGDDIPTAGKVMFSLVIDGVTKTATIDFTGTSGPIAFTFTNVAQPTISAQMYVQGIGNSQIWLGTGCKFITPQSQLFDVKNLNGIQNNDWARVLPSAPGAECRPPKFTWYKGLSILNMVPIYERTSSPVGPFSGAYRNSLERPNDPLFEYGYFYAFESDCGCDKTRRYYSCLGPAAQPTKFQPCLFPDTINVDVTACGASIEFPDGVEFTCSLLDGVVPAPAIEFEVLIDGVVSGTYSWANGYAIQPGTVVVPAQGGASTVTVRLKGAVCTCSVSVDLEDANQFRGSMSAVGGSGCGDDTLLLNVAITPSGNPNAGLPYNIVLLHNGVPVIPTNSGPFYANNFQVELLNAVAGSYTMEVTNAQGCTITIGPVLYAPLNDSPFTITTSCYHDINLPNVPPTFTLTVTNALGVTTDVVLDGSPLAPSVPAGGSRTYQGLPANVGVVPVTVTSSANPLCQLATTIDTACCWIDPYSSSDFNIISTNPGAGTFDVAVAFSNTNGFLTSRFGLSLGAANPLNLVADSNNDTVFVLAPGTSVIKTYLGLSLNAVYTTFAQWNDWPVVNSCFNAHAPLNPACESFQNLTHVQSVVGVAPIATNDGISVTLWSLCWPGSPSNPPQVYIQNDTPVNLLVYFDNVYTTTLSAGSWSPNLGLSVNNSGTHTWRFVDANDPTCFDEITTSVDCGDADPPGGECDELAALTHVTVGNNRQSPGCSSSCPPSWDVCVVMCCDYGNNQQVPGIPWLLLYNNSGYAVNVYDDDTNQLLVSAAPNTQFAVSATSFNINGSIDIRIEVEAIADTCIIRDTLLWACTP